MSRDFIITANASEVSGADFLRGLLGKAPLTPSEIAQREAEKRRLVAERNEQDEREMMELRRRILAMFKTDAGRAACLARFEAEGVDCSALVEIEPKELPDGRWQVAA